MNLEATPFQENRKEMSSGDFEKMEEQDPLELSSSELSMAKRRRDSSVSEDYNVQMTNDDATDCKRFAVSLGYWNDPYVETFGHGHKPERREPEINRGYWARVASIRILIDQFLQKSNGKGQIVNLGSGYDTLYWQLCESKASFTAFVDVDFSSITAKKIHQIMKPGSLLMPFVAEQKSDISVLGHTDLHGPKYHLLGADLRQLKELSSKLNSFHLDLSLPTLFLCECVLVYMSTSHSASLIDFLAKTFPNSCFVNYEQVNLDDKFGSVMKDNLHTRGITLAGIAACESLESQKQRFLDNGFTNAWAHTLDEIYKSWLPSSEIDRITKLEMLDEQELLDQLLEHYSISFASKGDLAKSDIKFS